MKILYWASRGRAEQIRLLCNELSIPYEDVDCSDTFAQMRAARPRVLPFGSLPMLEDGAFRLAQGPVICSYLAAKHGVFDDGLPPQAALQRRARADSIAWGAEDLRLKYYEQFGGDDAAARQKKFVEGSWRKRWLPSFDDLLGDDGFFAGPGITHADFCVFDALDATLQWVNGATLDGHPRLQAFMDAIRARPRIAAYLASPRRHAE